MGVVDAELGDVSWMQAQLGIAMGGLGIRDARRHEPAAYVASAWGCRHLCSRIDAEFDLQADGGHFADAQRDLQRWCLPAANLQLTDVPVDQKQLSARIDGGL